MVDRILVDIVSDPELVSSNKNFVEGSVQGVISFFGSVDLFGQNGIQIRLSVVGRFQFALIVGEITTNLKKKFSEQGSMVRGWVFAQRVKDSLNLVYPYPPLIIKRKFKEFLGNFFYFAVRNGLTLN